MFTEMRTAALLQKALHGPEVLPATRALRMATIDGARAVGLEEEIGSVELGKKADLSVVSLNGLHSSPQTSDLISSIVYSCQPADVRTVFVDGQMLMSDRKLVTLDESEVIREAERQTSKLLVRAGLN